MEPEDHPFHPDEVDEQIDRSPDEEIIPLLHALYSAEAREMDRALERGRARLAQSQAAFTAQQEPNPTRHLSLVLPGRQPITELSPMPPQRYRRWSLRLGSLVAAALLFTLVGGLLVGLVLVRHNKTGTTLKTTPTTQASATGTTAPPARANLYLISAEDFSIVKVNATTGNVLWTYKWKKLTEGGTGFGSLVIGDGLVYFSAGEVESEGTANTNTLYALDAQTGALRWQMPAPGGAANPQLAGNGVVYVTGNGGIYALNASDGSERWHRLLGGDASTLVLANGVLFGTTLSQSLGDQWSSSLFAVNAGNGALLWLSPLPADKSFILSTVVNGTLYLTSAEQRHIMAYVYAYSQDGKQLWQSQSFIGYLSRLTVVDGTIYFTGDSTAYAMSVQDGTLLWQHRVEEGAILIAGPIVVNGEVFLESVPPNSNSSVAAYIFALDAKHGMVLWKQRLDTLPNLEAGPCVLGNGLLYILIAGSPLSILEAFNSANGSLVWQKILRGTFYTIDITVAP